MPALKTLICLLPYVRHAAELAIGTITIWLPHQPQHQLRLLQHILAPQVLASIEDAHLLEPPLPGKLIPAVAAAGADGHRDPASASFLADLKSKEKEFGQEVKVSMQSHFD